MAEAVGCVRHHLGRCLVGGMIAVVFVAVVSLMPLMSISFFRRRRCLMHLLRRHAHSHVCRHSVAGPAAQRQQNHHESEHEETHVLNDKGKGLRSVDQAGAAALALAVSIAARRSKTSVNKASIANGTPTQARLTKPSVSSKAPLMMLPSAVPM